MIAPTTRGGAAWGASIGALLAYTVGALRPGPTPLYFPRLGVWGWHARTGEPAIAWFGLLIELGIGAALGALLGARLRHRPSWHLAWGLGALALILLAWHERRWFVP